MKKFGLTLGSGGSRGVAHIGFLQALDENGIRPDFVTGSSMGAVVGGLYCSGMKPADMINEAVNLKRRDILDLSATAISGSAILRSEKIKNVLDKYFSGATFENLKIPFRCMGADLRSGKKVCFSKGDVATAVCASSSIPMIFKPVQYDDMLVADGGLLCRLPIEEVKNMGADVTVAIDVLGPLREMEELKNIFSYLFRVVDIYDMRITRLLLDKCPPDILVSMPLGDMNQYKIEKIRFAYDTGYAEGIRCIPKIKELIGNK